MHLSRIRAGLLLVLALLFAGRLVQLSQRPAPLRNAPAPARTPTSIWIDCLVSAPPRGPSVDNAILVLTVERFRMAESDPWTELQRPEKYGSISAPTGP